MLWREKSFDHEERRERGREIKLHTGDCTGKTISQNCCLGKQEGLIIGSFYKQWSWECEVLAVCAITRSSLVGVAILLWIRSAEAHEWRPCSAECIWERQHCFLGTKGPRGYIELPNSLAYEQLNLLWAANLDAILFVCLFIASLYHKLQTLVWLCKCLSGTNWYQPQ